MQRESRDLINYLTGINVHAREKSQEGSLSNLFLVSFPPQLKLFASELSRTSPDLSRLVVVTSRQRSSGPVCSQILTHRKFHNKRAPPSPGKALKMTPFPAREILANDGIFIIV